MKYTNCVVRTPSVRKRQRVIESGLRLGRNISDQNAIVFYGLWTHTLVWEAYGKTLRRTVVPSGDRISPSLDMLVRSPTSFGFGRAGERKVEVSWERASFSLGRKPSARVPKEFSLDLWHITINTFRLFNYQSKWFKAMWSLTSSCYSKMAHTCDVNLHLVMCD